MYKTCGANGSNSLSAASDLTICDCRHHFTLTLTHPEDEYISEWFPLMFTYSITIQPVCTINTVVWWGAGGPAGGGVMQWQITYSDRALIGLAVVGRSLGPHQCQSSESCWRTQDSQQEGRDLWPLCSTDHRYITELHVVYMHMQPVADRYNTVFCNL